MNATEKRTVGRPRVGRPIHLRMPVDLIAWADEQAAEAGQTRADFLRDALEYARAMEFPEALREAFGEHYGRTATGELIGPYDTVEELERELAR